MISRISRTSLDIGRFPGTSFVPGYTEWGGKMGGWRGGMTIVVAATIRTSNGRGVRMAETHRRVCVERRKGNTIARPRSANIRSGLVGGI